MRKIFKRTDRRPTKRHAKGPKLSRHDAEEFGPGKLDILFCSEGDEVYYRKSWHHNLRRYPYLKETKPVRFKLCPYHQMKKNRQWEGEVRVAGVPEKYREQILKTAEGVSGEAYRRDPMHRILNIKNTNKELVIYTSENQLASRIAKRVSESVKNHFFKPETHKDKGGDPVLITMEWKSLN